MTDVLYIDRAKSESLQKIFAEALTLQKGLELLAMQACEVVGLDPDSESYETQAIKDIAFNGVEPMDALFNLQRRCANPLLVDPSVPYRFVAYGEQEPAL